MCDQEAALLAAVRADPADDLPRLVYADWLEERGEVERAELIRVQVELSLLQAASSVDYAYCAAGGSDKTSCRTCNLKQRECELLEELAPSLFPDAVKVNRRWVTDRNWGEVPWLEPCLSDATSPAQYLFRRGWVSEVRCRLAEWVGGPCGRCNGRANAPNPFPGCPDCTKGTLTGIGPAVCAAQPVTSVVLTDREPWQERPDVFGWWRQGGEPGGGEDDESDLPPAVFEEVAARDPDYHPSHQVVWFPTRAAALAALSAALIAWAKARPA
jgi:uncharacterized protein (TIGR02996 family)